MSASVEQEVVISKTEELCKTILEQPEIVSARKDIDAFTADADLQQKYQTLMELGGQMQQMQQMGNPPAEDMIADFDAKRNEFLDIPVAKAFLEAQNTMGDLQNKIGKYIQKTFELGRVPTEADFESGCCSSGGCGCS